MENPADGSDWVYAGTDNKQYDFATVSRFPIDAPEKRELVWNATLVSMEGFNVTPDGRRAGGMCPWPNAGIADLPRKTWKKFGEGCWTSLTNARGPLFWYFDGAHRNVTMVDVDTAARWMVNINNAPGFDGAEVSHPRWTNHPRFFAISGPYNQGGSNQVRSGGKQVEIYLGRFSADFSRVEAWQRVTNNSGGDSHPDVWIDLASTPHPRQPAGPIGPPQALAAKPGEASPKSATGRLVLNVRLKRPGTIPNPQSILPYRHGLVVNEYEVVDVIQGTYAGNDIRIAQWAIRDSKVLPGARKAAGAAFTLTVERYDAHPELEGERLLSDSETSALPLYYDRHPPLTDGLQLVSLPLLLPSGRSAAVLRRPAAGAAPDPDARQLRLLRLGEPAVLVPAPVLHARRLHRGPGDRARRTAPLVTPDRQARPERSEGARGSARR